MRPSGCRKMIIELRELGDWMLTPQMVPSGAVKDFMILGGGGSSADQCRRERLAAGISGIQIMPELDRGLAELPAEQHGTAIEFARKVDQPDAAVLQLDVERFELHLKAVDLPSDLLDAAFERYDARIGKLRMHTSRNQVELDDRFLPAPVLANDVLDDFPDERKGAIGLVDGEKLHVGNL